MPSLHLVYVSRDIDVSPTAIFSAAIVGANGSVLMTTDRSSDLRLVVVDSTGSLAARFGATGEGPGELRGPRPIGFAGDTAVVYDLAQLRIASFDGSGTFIASTRVKAARAMPLFMLDEDRMVSVVGGPAGSRPGLMSRQDGFTRAIVDDADTLARRLARQVNAEGRQLTIGWWAQGPLIADGGSYEIGLYDMQGNVVRTLRREVAPPRNTEARAAAEIRDFLRAPPGRRASEADLAAKKVELLDESLPHFYHTTAPRPDGAGRLWILGRSADSAYADVFSPEAFLGRLELACPAFSGGWSVRGRWLAVTCASTDPSYHGDAVLHLYRIG